MNFEILAFFSSEEFRTGLWISKWRQILCFWSVQSMEMIKNKKRSFSETFHDQEVLTYLEMRKFILLFSVQSSYFSHRVNLSIDESHYHWKVGMFRTWLKLQNQRDQDQVEILTHELLSYYFIIFNDSF